MIELSRQYGRYGYRRIAVLLRDALWQVNDKRVERLWRSEEQKYPANNPTRVACGEMTDHVSACGQLTVRISGPMTLCITGQMTAGLLRTLNLIDEYTRECLEIRVKRKLNSTDVIDLLTDLFILRGIPVYIQSDNGPEFVAQAVRDWIKAVGRTLR